MEGSGLLFACESKNLKSNHHLVDGYTTNMQNKGLHVYALLGSLGKCNLYCKALTRTGEIITAVVLEKTLPVFAYDVPACC